MEIFAYGNICRWKYLPMGIFNDEIFGQISTELRCQTCFQSEALWLFLCDLLSPKNDVDKILNEEKLVLPPHAMHCFPIRRQH